MTRKLIDLFNAFQEITSYATQNPIPTFNSGELALSVEYLRTFEGYFNKKGISDQSAFYYLALLFEQSIDYYSQLNDMDNLFPLGDLLLAVEDMFPNVHNQLAMRNYAYNVIMLNLRMVNQEIDKSNWIALDAIKSELAILRSHSFTLGFISECIPSIEASEKNLAQLEKINNARVMFFSMGPALLYPKQVEGLSTSSTSIPVRPIDPSSAFNLFNL